MAKGTVKKRKGAKADALICVTYYDKNSCAENIIEACIVSDDTSVDGFVLRLSLPDFLNYVSGYRRKLKVYVDNLKVFGECAIAYMYREHGCGAFECKGPGRLIDLYPEQFNIQRDLYRIMGNEQHWYKFDFQFIGRKQITVVDWRNLMVCDSADIYNEYGAVGDVSIAQSVARLFKELMAHIKIDSKLTIGSVALQYFKDMIGPKKYEAYFPELDDDMRQYMRAAYHGGLAGKNCDKVLENKFDCDGLGYAYDNNSMYSFASCKYIPYGKPYKMELAEFAKYYKYIAHGDASDIIADFGDGCDVEDVVSRWCPIFKVRVDIKRLPGHMPCIYHTYETRITAGAPIWETRGPEELIMTRADLESMVRHYELRDIEYVDGYYFDTSDSILREYHEYWYEEKRKARAADDKVRLRVSKMMLNNLSGKFGQKLKARNQYVKDYDGKVLFGYHDDATKGGYAPAAAYITAYARQILADKASENWDHVIQYDTDCIFYDQCMDSYFDIGERMGQWKVEHRYKSVYCHATKVYMMLNDDGQLEIKAAGASDGVIRTLLRPIEGYKEYIRNNVYPGDDAYSIARREEYTEKELPSYIESLYNEYCDRLASESLNNVRGKIMYVHDAHGSHATENGIYSFCPWANKLIDYDEDCIDNSDDEDV